MLTSHLFLNLNFGLYQKELICRLGGLDVCLSGTSLVGGWVGSALMLVGDLKAEHLDLTRGGKGKGLFHLFGLCIYAALGDGGYFCC